MRILTLLAFILCSVGLSSQEFWTLDKALKHAEENSLSIIQAQNLIRQSNIDLSATRQRRLPSLNFSGNHSTSLGRTIDPTTNTFTTESNNNQSLSLSTGIQLFNGGLLHKQVADAQLFQDISRLSADATEQDVKLQVVQLFFQALFAQENVEIAVSNLKLLDEQMIRTEREVEAGSKPENELLEIEAEYASSEQRLIEAQNQQDVGLLRFKQVLQLPVDKEIELGYPDLLDTEIEPWQALNMTQLRSKAISVSPEINAAQLRIERAQLGIGIAQSQYYPSISLGGSFSTNFSSVRSQAIPTGVSIDEQNVYLNGDQVVVGFENPTYRFEPIPYTNQLRDNWGLGLGLSLSLPIYSQGQISANVERAKINHRDAEIQKELQEQGFREEFEITITDVKSSYRSFVAAQKTLDASTKFFENVNLSFKLGASNSFDLINAQNRKEQAEINLIIAKYDYLARKKSLGIYLQE
ncbi:TolC family protein [Membranihabitans maritimus]|uniref:TolC family protein n=1 Tax=Membranihabitans maritimus TaxID=2904244 RepID=UPI001F177058|nr:TolC family protein [Membranihabitans maritimus]